LRLNSIKRSFFSLSTRPEEKS